MVVSFIVDETRLVVILNNFRISSVDNMAAITGKDTMILEFICSSRKRRWEFRKKVFESRQWNLTASLIESGLRWNKIRNHVKVIHNFIIGSSFSHADNKTHGIVEREFALVLTHEIVSRIVWEEPVMLRHVSDDRVQFLFYIWWIIVHNKCVPP